MSAAGMLLLSAFALPREMLHTLTVPNATAANRGYVDGVSVQAVSQTPIYDGPVQEVSRAPSLSAEWCEAHPRNYGCVVLCLAHRTAYVKMTRRHFPTGPFCDRFPVACFVERADQFERSLSHAASVRLGDA